MDPRDSRKISAEILYERGLVVEIQGAVIQLETPDNSRNWKWVVSLEDSEAIFVIRIFQFVFYIIFVTTSVKVRLI